MCMVGKALCGGPAGIPHPHFIAASASLSVAIGIRPSPSYLICVPRPVEPQFTKKIFI